MHTSQGEVYAEGGESERNAGKVTNDLAITLEKRKGQETENSHAHLLDCQHLEQFSHENRPKTLQ